MQKYVVKDKRVGETPLQVVKQFQTDAGLENVPMAYAGRLDPMASGKLLILIGEECKKQSDYHGLDKAYRFEVLFGTSSDTGDVLGLLEWKKTDFFNKKSLEAVAKKLVGRLALPYPHFSSKTVKGKPLHVWTLEKRLDEIDIPVANTTMYDLKLVSLRSLSAKEVYEAATAKIETIPKVTEASKALGQDFRRDDVRMSWRIWLENHKNERCQIATFDCVASSGTYMRSLAPLIAKELGTAGLAYSIHRLEIGQYLKLPLGLGFWRRRFK